MPVLCSSSIGRRLRRDMRSRAIPGPASVQARKRPFVVAIGEVIDPV